MTTFLLGVLLAFPLGVFVGGRSELHRFRTTLEQLLEAARLLLADVPSKSAGRTVAADDAPRFVPFAGLRWAAEVRERLAALTKPEPELDDIARWSDDGGADVPPPVHGPDTRPAAAVLVEHWSEGATVPIPTVLDDVDRLLMTRWNLTEGRAQ